MPRRRFVRGFIGRVRSGPGVYKLYAKHAKKPTYIGSAEDLRRRLLEHRRTRRYHSFKTYHTDDIDEARAKEKRMIRVNKPRRNKNL